VELLQLALFANPRQDGTTVDVLGSQVELAQPAQATRVLTQITVWVAVAPTLEPERYVRLAARLDNTTVAAVGPAMELASSAQASVAPRGITTWAAQEQIQELLWHATHVPPTHWGITTVVALDSTMELARHAQATVAPPGFTMWAAAAL